MKEKCLVCGNDMKEELAFMKCNAGHPDYLKSKKLIKKDEWEEIDEWFALEGKLDTLHLGS